MRGVLTFILGLALLFLIPFSVNAAPLTNSYIRYDRLSANTTTTGIICVTPSTTAIENSVQITFPNSFVVNTSISNWSVSTSNLPSDATAWPGISTATSVSGQTVTFPSGDLNPSTLYCFSWTNQNALQTGPVAVENTVITTKNSLNSTVDTGNFYTQVISSDQITVTATVLPQSNDVETSISGNPIANSVIAPNKEMQITIQYRSLAGGSFPLKLIASWDKGLIEGSSGSYIDILEYKPNSATQAHDGSAPIIDLANRRITWEINNLTTSPTPHTIQFILRTEDTFNTLARLSGSIHLDGEFASSSFAQQNLQYYFQEPEAEPTATSVPGPTATNTPVSITPTPTLTHRIQNIEFTEIQDTSVSVTYQTSDPSTVTATYGTAPRSLTKRLSFPTLQRRGTLKIEGIEPNTIYYIEFTFIFEDGKTLRSDLFSIKTASTATTLTLGQADYRFYSNNLPINSPFSSRILIPTRKRFTLSVQVNKNDGITDMTAELRRADVLGITNRTIERPPTQETQLIETVDGIFSGELSTPPDSGNYEVLISVNYKGDNHLSVVAPYQILVLPRLRIEDQNNHKPVERALVTVKRFQEHTQSFVNTNTFFTQDYYTDEFGEIDLPLQEGRYQISVQAAGYKAYKEELILDLKNNKYPTIQIQSPNTVIGMVEYYTHSLTDIFSFIYNTIMEFFSSSRLHIGVIVLIDLVVISFGAAVIVFRIQRHSKKINTAEAFIEWLFELSTVILCDIIVALHILMTIASILFIGFFNSIPLICATLFIFMISAMYIYKIWSIEHPKKL